MAGGHEHSAAAEVELRSVTKRFGDGRPAVDAIDLSIRPGEFLTMLGPSGSGKTTTLNMIAGFLSITSGSIELDGRDISGTPPHKRDIGMVFQSYALFPHMTVAQNIAYPLRQRKVDKAETRRRVDEALAMVHLEGYADRLPRQLSGGQQQRVAVARAIVFRPRLLLMDEPLGALDRKLREFLQLEIRRIHRELGVTIVYVTHDQEEALVMSDRIAVFNDGRIEQIDAPDALYDRPNTQYVAQFLGDSNVWRGTVRHDGTTSIVDTPGGLLRGVRTEAVAEGAQTCMVVRPERTGVVDVDAPVPEGANVLDGVVKEVVYLGAQRRLIVDVAGHEVIATVPAGHVGTTSGAVRVVFGVDDARVIAAGNTLTMSPAETILQT
jgi:putative spermidine/putrescine transport system ATP-binding protein